MNTDQSHLYAAGDKRIAVLYTDGASQTSAWWMPRHLNDQAVKR